MMMMTITQDYFDELIFENAVLFGGSDEDAVEETIAQLLSTTMTTSPNNDATKESCLGHLSWTHPHSDSGIQMRQQIVQFRQALQRVDVVVNSDEDQDAIHDCLLTIQSRCRENKLFINLLVVEHGIETLVDRWIRMHAKLDPYARQYECIAKILVSTVTCKRSFQDQFQKVIASVQTFPPAWIEAFTWSRQQQQQQASLALLQLAFYSMVRCEANKRIWMNQTENPHQFTKILLETLQTILSIHNNQREEQDDEAILVGRWISRIFTTLCTFDDFRKASTDTIATATADATDKIVMQSGPEHGIILAEQGALPILKQYIQTFPHKNDAAVASIRAMAIQDEIVQSIVSLGVLDTVVTLLENTISENSHASQSSSSSIDGITAAIGLFRNVAANDHVKKRFIYMYQIHDTILHVMRHYGHVPLIQEHAAGFVAALCLRHPDHAMALIQNGIHVEIVAAMERFPQHATLQRQAALAIRNLISRCPEYRSKLLHDADTERVLREIASQHGTCQDEVYAALRDLGLAASCVHVIIPDDDGDDDATGQVKVQRQRPTFGERNPNFRPVFEES